MRQTPNIGGVNWLAGKLIGANMNATTDQAIPIVLPPGFSNYVVNSVRVTNASISLTTAVGGIYTTTAKGGFAIVANSQTYSALTAAAFGAAGSASFCTVTTNAWYNANPIYLSLTTPQGATATADFYVYVLPIS